MSARGVLVLDMTTQGHFPFLFRPKDLRSKYYIKSKWALVRALCFIPMYPYPSGKPRRGRSTSSSTSPRSRFRSSRRPSASWTPTRTESSLPVTLRCAQCPSHKNGLKSLKLSDYWGITICPCRKKSLHWLSSVPIVTNIKYVSFLFITY